MNKAEISAAGFSAVRRSPKRIVANIQSIRKSVGKTRLALTGPKPLGYISVEIGGEEGVIDSFIEDGQESNEGIQIARVRMATPTYPDAGAYPNTKEGKKEYDAAVAEAVQLVAAPAMDQFYAAYYASLANMRTTVVDTGTDVYLLARLANFGRIERVPQLAYGQINKEFAKMLDDAYASPGNCIWLHHMKDRGIMVEEKGSQKWQASGVYEMDGCKIITDKVQAVIELWRDDLKEASESTGRMVKFNCQVVDSRHSPDAMGTVLCDDQITLADLGMLIVGGSKKGDWV